MHLLQPDRAQQLHGATLKVFFGAQDERAPRGVELLADLIQGASGFAVADPPAHELLHQLLAACQIKRLQFTGWAL